MNTLFADFRIEFALAITHFTPQLIGRGSGRSAVLAAAYRHCARMEHEAEARTVDYTAKRGLIHEEFLLPPDAPAWARALVADRSVASAAEVFWNRVEGFEKRQDAQFAKEFIIALPVELTAQQNVDLMGQFVLEQVLARGQVADWVYHDEPGNPHVHLMTSLRPLTENGFGPKKIAVVGEDGQPLRNKAGKIVYQLWSGEKQEFLAQRQGWLDLQNQHLALAGLDIRVDGRSYAERGIDLVPTVHIGVAAKAIERKADREGRASDLERLKLFEDQRQENARRIQQRPEIVLDMISREKSVFDERDIAKALHRYIDDADRFQNLLARVLQSPELLRLEREHISLATGKREAAKLTTRELIGLEAGMAARAIWLSRRSSHGVSNSFLEQTFKRHERLSEEQRAAIELAAGGARIAAIVGRAGAGKTTMMKAAREAWEAAGYRVVGGALAGKAAEGLETEAGIVSRTLSSWELRWQQQRDLLDKKTVFVLDEAGMVSSRQMALFVEAATKAGAKLVLVGDPDQLQPIEAGAAFRAIADRIGYAELGIIYRQREEWMRKASIDLARGNIGAALGAYDNAGMVLGEWTRDGAIQSLIKDWNTDYDASRTSLILAHMRRDVRELNELAREKLVERGVVGEGFAFQTEDGIRKFAAGDQIVFLKNEGSLGVKNGLLAKVVDAAPGRIVAQIGDGDDRREITVEQRFYSNVDHGYATTIHKSQGATVDSVKVLASGSLDRHLTYVALTRHRDAAQLYVALNDFTRTGGVLVNHGVAPYENKPDNRDSYFVILKNGEGQQSTIWGVDLERAMKQAAPNIGDRIGLKHDGSQSVTLPDGQTVQRHTWEVTNIRELALSRLTERLSRDGSKQTTLDYAGGGLYRDALRFANGRGLHIVRVARTLVRDRLQWTLRQKQHVADIVSRLRTIGPKLGLLDTRETANLTPSKEMRPMVAGVTTWSKSVQDSIEEKVLTDPGIKKQWEEVSTRFRLVFADPEAALKAMNLEAVIKDPSAASRSLATLSNDPASIAPLRGKLGLLASKADRDDRRIAELNAPALKSDVERYVRLRTEAAGKIEAEERALRSRVAVDIPALSPQAALVLERIRDAIDRNDLPSALGFALADKMVKAEIDGFIKAIADRIGDRALLTNAAREPSGPAFEKAALGMRPPERERLASAWPTMRSAQQLAAHERTAEALKQTEALRQDQRQSQVLK